MTKKTKFKLIGVLIFIVALAIGVLYLLFSSNGASLFSSKAETIGTVYSKGLISKDKIDINVFDDPTIKGAACYITNHTYGGINIFGEGSSSTSISCRQVGPIEKDSTLCDMKNIFKQRKGIFFKNNIIDRFYDKKRNVLIYISYTKDMNTRNASHSISVVPIKEW